MNFIKKNNRNFAALFAWLCLAILSAACSDGESTNASSAPFSKYFPMQISGKSFEAQIAISDVEKACGLMFCQSLPADCAMLFVYDTPRKASFWMKNTPLYLDLAFFDSDGILTEVKALYPHDENAVNSARADIKFCLETNSGWFERNKISIGAKLDSKFLKTAIKARSGK